MSSYTQEKYEQECHKALMSLPINNPERNKLRDAVKGDAKKLAARAHKYLTMSAEYKARETFQRKRYEPEPPLAQRLARLAPCTRQSPCKAFESGKNTLDYYIPSEQQQEAA